MWPPPAQSSSHRRMLGALGHQLRCMAALLDEYSRTAALGDDVVDAFSKDLATGVVPSSCTYPSASPVLAEPKAVACVSAKLAESCSTIAAKSGPLRVSGWPKQSKVEPAASTRASEQPLIQATPPHEPGTAAEPVKRGTMRAGPAQKKHASNWAKGKLKPSPSRMVDFANSDKFNADELVPYELQFIRLIRNSGKRVSGAGTTGFKQNLITAQGLLNFFRKYNAKTSFVTEDEIVVLLELLRQRYRLAHHRMDNAGTCSMSSMTLCPEDGINFDMFLELQTGEELAHYLPAEMYDVAVRTRKALAREMAEYDTLQQTEIAEDADGAEGMSKTEVLTAVVILLNALVLGLSADIDPNHVVWKIFEYCFTVYFAAEMVLKVFVQGPRDIYLGPELLWNWFDTVVVVIALADISFTFMVGLVDSSGSSTVDFSQFAIIKMVRLLRLARLVRLLRFRMFEELKMMVVGVFAGLRVLFWAIVLFFFFIFLLGMVMRQTVGVNSAYYTDTSFGTLPWSMYTLFRCFTDGCAAEDGTPLQVHLYHSYGAPFMLCYMLVFLFVTIGLFNLIMAIFVENVMETTKRRKMEARKGEAGVAAIRLRNVLDKLAKTLGPPPEDETEAVIVKVTREVFLHWLEDEEFNKIMEDLDIHVTNRSDLFDVLDSNMDGELTVEEVTTGMMKLRGPAEKSDAIAAWLCSRAVQSQVREFETRCMRNILAIAATNQDILLALAGDDSDSGDEAN